jgi:hypothetical protein
MSQTSKLVHMRCNRHSLRLDEFADSVRHSDAIVKTEMGPYG